MQLDPRAHLVRQLEHLSSTKLEGVTAATFASVGFFVLRDLKYEVGGQTAAQVDVFSSIFSPLREQRILLECKGGHPTFNDIQQFASLRQLLDPAPDELVIICREACPGNRLQVAADLHVSIIEKPRLTTYVLPILGGAGDRQRRARELNRYLVWQVLHEYFAAFTARHALIREHYRFLTAELWSIGSPEQQTLRSFEMYQDRFSRASDQVARDQGLDPSKIVYDAPDDLVESAMYVMTIHRLMNAYGLTRRTLEVMRRQAGSYLIAAVGPALRAVISELSKKPRYLLGFPAFLQEFLYIWGGFIYWPERDFEIASLAAACDTTPDAVDHYLRVVKHIYAGPIGSLLAPWRALLLFRYVPAAFRQLGILHRRALDPTRYAGVTFFHGSEPKYAVALERALGSIGGARALHY